MIAKFTACLRNEDGGPAVEMGLIAPFLVTLILGIITYGMIIFQILEVNNAAQAGAMYAVINGTGSLVNIETAETAATELAVTTPAPTIMSCGCVVIGFAINAATCGTTCPFDGTAAGTYVTVTANFATLQSIAFLPSVSGQSFIRVK
jgi:Flp pilus assembly protein TadG